MTDIAINETGLAPDPAPESAPRLGDTPRRKRRLGLSPSLIVALALVLIVVLMIVVIPFLPGYDPLTQDLTKRFLLPGSPGHLLGTDQLGRDMLDRLALAGRTSLSIAIPAVAVNIVIGVLLGLFAGYFGGWLDNVISALADIQLAIPIMLLLIAIVSAIGPSEITLIVVIGLTNWVGYARVSRATAWQLREREFMWAPKTHGASRPWIMRKHLLPNVIPSLAVLVPFDIGVIILLEAALSYLGLGIQAPTPSWGGMIKDGQAYLSLSPLTTVLPGIMLFMLVAGLQFASQRLTGERDGVRQDAFSQ
ncbi:ABC transporter permease [Frondihabitans cladoniiphilus]|uniref:ABC transporter permease n=1 Tax=Frondihabitans cladoniiphilus TaxID=715785 RepID=A0ABP8W3U6_9MICO